MFWKCQKAPSPIHLTQSTEVGRGVLMENKAFSVSHRKIRIGPYELSPIPTGIFGLDGGAMFGTVPKVLWEKTNPPDANNRIPMEARALLLKSKDKCILIDTGNGGDFVQKYGDKLGSKFSNLYNLSPDGSSLKNSLSKIGISPSNITDVILTHLHFDHAGGATEWRDQRLLPTFPQAKYHLQKRNFETARSPNLREKASYFPANFQPLLESGVLHLVDGPIQDLLPGISVQVSDGHTLGQQIVYVTDESQGLVYAGDLIPTSTHVRIPWLMGYDLNPLLLMEEKQQHLGKIADKKWLVFFEHDPYCDAATIERQGDDFKIQERFWI